MWHIKDSKHMYDVFWICCWISKFKMQFIHSWRYKLIYAFGHDSCTFDKTKRSNLIAKHLIFLSLKHKAYKFHCICSNILSYIIIHCIGIEDDCKPPILMAITWFFQLFPIEQQVVECINVNYHIWHTNFIISFV